MTHQIYMMHVPYPSAGDYSPLNIDPIFIQGEYTPDSLTHFSRILEQGTEDCEIDELYLKLVCTGRHEEAWRVFHDYSETPVDSGLGETLPHNTIYTLLTHLSQETGKRLNVSYPQYLKYKADGWAVYTFLRYFYL